MKVSELLKEFPEKSFSEEFEEQIKYIRSFHNQIDDEQVINFKDKISKIFIIDDIINDFKLYLLANPSINISDNDYNYLNENGLSIVKNLIILFKNTNNFDLNKKDLYQIFGIFYGILSYNPENYRLSFLSDEYIYTPRTQQIGTGKKVIDTNIEKLNSVIRLIKLENEKKENFSQENLGKISDLLEKAKLIDEKFPEIEKKMESFLNFEKNITKEQIEKIGDFYIEQGKILNKTNYKNVLFFIKNKFEWKNTDWIILSIVTGVLIISFSIFNIYNKGETILSTLPSIATLSVFLIFFLKQYSNNRNLINSYNFKGTSANIMEHLLTTREDTAEGKLILEKTLDKILEDPVIHQKGGNDTINLVNTSLKTPGS